MSKYVVGVFLFLGAILALHAGFGWVTNYQSHQILHGVAGTPIFLHNGDGKARKDFKAGDVMYLHFTTVRNAACRIDVSYRIMREVVKDSIHYRDVYESYPTSSGYLAPATYVVNIRLPIPSYLAPGSYQLDRVANYSCAGLKIDRSPQIPFNIVP